MLLRQFTVLVVSIMCSWLAASDVGPYTETEEQPVNQKPMTREEAAALLGDRITFKNNGDAATVGLHGKSASPDMLRAIEFFPELYGLGVVNANVDVAEAIHALQQLPNLTYVQFVRCPRITDDILPVVAALPNLESGNFTGTGVTDHGMPALLESKSLISVTFSDTTITDAGVRTLANLPTLECLEIRNTAVTDAGLEALRGHKRLASLWVRGCKVGDDGMRHIATCPLLQEVLARQTHLTDAGIENVATAKNLKLLQASGTFSRRSIAALATCGELHSFLLEGKIDLGDEDIETFAPFKGSRSIGLWGSRITEAGEARLKAMLPKTRVSITAPE